MLTAKILVDYVFSHVYPAILSLSFMLYKKYSFKLEEKLNTTLYCLCLVLHSNF